ncbi:MAG: acetyl-CoA hydrolase/transferase family protein [Myxococcales bacterium]|nr:acetyl-CoA hydrolase/transferase family protein [Myxococcales bacterium]
MVSRSAADAISVIQSGMRVFVHGGAATPNVLLEALVEQADRLRDVEIIHLHTEGPAVYADEKYARSFTVANLFVGGNLRKRFDCSRIDYIPCFLSEIPALLRSRRRKIDVALLQLSPPDTHGFCSLGVSVDVARAAAEVAETVIAQINPQMPRVHGDGFIHIDTIHHAVLVDSPLHEARRSNPTEQERAIGRFCAEMIENGSCLQMGIGSIPDAVLAALRHHKHLGIHTEMFSDGALDLIECGAVDNSQKQTHPGKTVSGFVVGTRKLYDYIHDNPSVSLLDIGYVNMVGTILRNKKVVAINSAVEVDLTGQVCADSIGHHIISGVGGQMDFIRGASLSPGGKPIIALTSRTAKDVPRIVPGLKSGAGVVTTRAHVHYVVTEYGVADLYGKTLNERAKALIGIAHPDDRESLESTWRDVRSQFG